MKNCYFVFEGGDFSRFESYSWSFNLLRKNFVLARDEVGTTPMLEKCHDINYQITIKKSLEIYHHFIIINATLPKPSAMVQQVYYQKRTKEKCIVINDDDARINKSFLTI